MLHWRGQLAPRGVGWAISLLLAGMLLLPLFGSVGASRQPPECDPAGSGCPIRFDEAVSGALVDPSDAHIWWLTVPIEGSFRLQLTNLPADYRLYVYAPDGTVAGQSNNPGLVDEILDVAATPGEYAVFVDSPVGEVSSAAYVLSAAWTGVAALPVATATQVPAQEVPPPPPTRVAEPTSVLGGPTREPAPPTVPARFPTPIQAQATPTRGPAVPETCTVEPALTLESTAVRSGEAVLWEAQGFRPGSSVRAQAFAGGTQPVSDVDVTVVESDCTTGQGSAVFVTAVARAQYYILRVTGQRYGTGSQVSLIARFSVSTSPR